MKPQTYYQKNKEKMNIQMKEWRANNLSWQKTYRKKNKETTRS